LTKGEINNVFKRLKNIESKKTHQWKCSRHVQIFCPENSCVPFPVKQWKQSSICILGICWRHK
jgi:hypothetical protein